MNKLFKAIALATFMMVGSADAFPYHTNSATFSTPTYTSYRDFNWTWSGHSHRVLDLTFNSEGYSHVIFRLSKPRGGTPYLTVYTDGLEVINGTTKLFVTLPSTNIPPQGTYYSEFTGANITTSIVDDVTNLVYSPTALLASGLVRTEWSVFDYGTNYKKQVIVMYHTGSVAGSYTETDPVFWEWYTNNTPVSSNYFETYLAGVESNLTTVSNWAWAAFTSGTDLVARAWIAAVSNIAVSASNQAATAASDFAGISNAIRNMTFGPITNDVTLGAGATRLLGKESRNLTFQGVNEGGTNKAADLTYFPYGGVDYLYWDGAYGAEQLVMSNGNVQADRMTNALDGIYARIGAGASATDAVSSITYTGAVKVGLRFHGDGITQIDTNFYWNNYLLSSNAATIYLTKNGGSITGHVDMGAKSVSNVFTLDARAIDLLPTSQETVSNSMENGYLMWANIDDNSYPYYRRSARGMEPFWGEWNLRRGITNMVSFTSSYATADATTNYALRTTYNAFTSAYNTAFVAFTGAYATADATTNYVEKDTIATTINGVLTTNVSGDYIKNSTDTSLVFRTGIGTVSLHSSASGAAVLGDVGNYGKANIGIASYGSLLRGSIGVEKTNTIGDTSYGSSIVGITLGLADIGDNAHGNLIQGWLYGRAIIGSSVSGGSILGYIGSGASATNLANGAVQIVYLVDGTTHALTTPGGQGSLLVGNGTASNKHSIVVGPSRSRGDNTISAAGKIYSDVGFVGDMSGGTNFPSSLRTIAAETAYNTNNTKAYTWATLTATQVLNYGSINWVGTTQLVIGVDYPTGTNKVWFNGVLNAQP